MYHFELNWLCLDQNFTENCLVSNNPDNDLPSKSLSGPMVASLLTHIRIDLPEATSPTNDPTSWTFHTSVSQYLPAA